LTCRFELGRNYSPGGLVTFLRGFGAAGAAPTAEAGAGSGDHSHADEDVVDAEIIDEDGK